MKRFLSLALLVSLAACTSENQRSPATAPTTSASEFFTLEDSPSMQFGNLKIYPIRATAAYHKEYSHLGNYMSLAEAVKSKKVKVKERHEVEAERSREAVNNILSPTGPGSVGPVIPEGRRTQERASADNSDVNGLVIQNNSEDTVFVMAGEVVEGGKQNRVIAQDFILKPRETKDMAVYCVEHGRWTAREGGNVFDNVFGVTSPAVRKQAMKHQSQAGVWDEVSNTLKTYNADNSTDTYTGLRESEQYQSGVGAYVSHFTEQMKGDKDIVGFVAVTGDEIIGMEIFYRNNLLNSQLGALVSSYATGASTTGDVPTKSSEEVKAYFEAQLERYDDYETSAEKDADYQMLAHRKRVVHYLTF